MLFQKKDSTLIHRDSIYVGKVVHPISIHQKRLDLSRSHFTDERSFSLISYRYYRSMLFQFNENYRCEDLLYLSPAYPILPFSSNDECFQAKAVISESYSLSPLLQYFDYQEMLSLADIKNIRNTFFNGTFGKEHCRLFGMREVEPEEWIDTYQDQSMSFEEREKLLQSYLLMKRCGQHIYVPCSNGVLPPEMKQILDSFGDNTWYEVFSQFDAKKNAFLPHPEEGFIRKRKI